MFGRCVVVSLYGPRSYKHPPCLFVVSREERRANIFGKVNDDDGGHSQGENLVVRMTAIFVRHLLGGPLCAVHESAVDVEVVDQYDGSVLGTLEMF